MKRTMVLLSSVLVVLATASVSRAHLSEGWLYFAVQFPDRYVERNLIIDGDLGDWDIIPDSPYLIGNNQLFDPDQYQQVDRGDIDPLDITIRHLVGWNDTYNQIYIATTIFDNVHNAAYGAKTSSR